MEQRMARAETTITDHERRIGNVEKLHTQLISLTADLTILVSKLDQIEKTVTGIDTKLNQHLMEPAQNWKALWWAVLMLGVGAVVALVLAKLNMGG